MASLKDERRDKKDATDDGLYSVFGKNEESDETCLSDRNINKFFVRVEARDRMALRWGVGFVKLMEAARLDK